jgi:hypothetical protein
VERLWQRHPRTAALGLCGRSFDSHSGSVACSLTPFKTPIWETASERWRLPASGCPTSYPESINHAKSISTEEQRDLQNPIPQARHRFGSVIRCSSEGDGLQPVRNSFRIRAALAAEDRGRTSVSRNSLLTSQRSLPSPSIESRSEAGGQIHEVAPRATVTLKDVFVRPVSEALLSHYVASNCGAGKHQPYQRQYGCGDH